MAIEKELKTRIQLKYDTLANWSAATSLILKKGEIAICAVPANNTAINGDESRPQILFKVGDGTSTFPNLPWASAKAADVYDWAKQASLPVTKIGDGNVVSNIEWDAVNKGIKFTTASVATSTQLQTVETNLTNLTTQVNAMYTNAKIDELVADAKKAGTDAASDLADYESSNDNRVKAVEDSIAAINNTSTGILATAKKYTDDEIAKIDERIDDLEAIDHDSFALKTEVASTYQTKEAAQEYESGNDNRVKAVEDEIAAIKNGESGILATAKEYADQLNEAMDARVDTLEAIQHETFALKTEVVSNTTFADFQTSNSNAIATAESNAKTYAKEYADGVKNDLLGNSETLTGTYDTLKEIHGWITGEGVNTTELTEAIAAEAKTRGEEDTRIAGLVTDEASRATNAEQALGARIDKLEDGTVVAKKAEEATKASQDINGNVIHTTYETKADASQKLTDAKAYADDQLAAAKKYTDDELADLKTELDNADDAIDERLAAVEGYFTNGIAKEAAKVSNALTVKLEDGSSKSYDGSAAVEIDLSEYATDGQVATAVEGGVTTAKSYTDTKVGDEATRAKNAEDLLGGRVTTLETNHINAISAGTGLKATKGTNSYEIAFDDEVVFVFNCGSATELID